MTRTRRQHAHEDFRASPSSDHGPLFAAPDIRFEAPSAPGSETSKQAAIDLSSPFRRETWRQILRVLYVEGKPLTREQLAERLGRKESSMCGRLSELRPVWVQKHDGYAIASSGCRVDAYSLTEAGRSRCAKSFSISSTGEV